MRYSLMKRFTYKLTSRFSRYHVIPPVISPSRAIGNRVICRAVVKWGLGGVMKSILKILSPWRGYALALLETVLRIGSNRL